ncbi:MAG: protein-glutamate O-methyltransferase CheR [Proteobacteria bacterium]|nr:protein-glutamate O-methyltransferase CheR [Pseudomonadota bacterium]
MQATSTAVRTSSPVPDLAGCWSNVQRFMVRHCGVVLTDDQSYLVESRLTSVAKTHNFVRITDFVSAACAASITSPLVTALIDAMTTHETLFFRDPPFWKNLEDLVLPKLVTRARTGSKVKIWSAACSSGQEPYSLAMLLAEKFPELVDKIEIVATDISELTVAKAREGVFSALETNRGLAATRLIKHFEQVTGGFRVRDSLCSRISWSSHNLLGSRPDPSNCDLVLCRNVLIYFGETDRSAVIRRLFQATLPGGIVGVGSTETLRETQLTTGLYVRSP